MRDMTLEIDELELAAVPNYVEEELSDYEEQIRRYRAGELDETKMQKLRLHFGTYAQRQEGVQMQRIKIPGGFLTADQLACLADAADRFGSGFIHFTTREDAQIYYVRLEEAPALLRCLAAAGITSREACGNTVRNVTACYRAGTSATETFNVLPYADALFRYLVRNKYNQNLGRKFKITFEGCTEDHSGLRIHDIGLRAVSKEEKGKIKFGFRVYLGGGLGATPHLAQLYTEFLPVEELLNLAAAILRLFDRYGERKARMKARMKFLVQRLGWDSFRAALDEERERVGRLPLSDYFREPDGRIPQILPQPNGLKVLDQRSADAGFQSWVSDSVIEHKINGFRGVHVRIKLGDLTADRARNLAAVSKRFSASQLRISIEQNIYLPWVREEKLFELYRELANISLAAPGASTIADITTCPGSDTCRLGIASAKGLGSALSEAFEGPLVKYAELARPLRIKISGCPNGCAHHSIADIGFYAAALSLDGRTVPAHFVTVGGQARMDRAQFGALLGKFPAKNCVQVTETLLGFYSQERLPAEDFNSFVDRIGTESLKQLIEPLRQVPSFDLDPSFYEDYGHEHERFAVRKGIKGECAGSTVAETVPTMDVAKEGLAQAEALMYHKEYEGAVIACYEAAAAAARVPLYQRLVDPFTSEQALWEFENIFVLSGQTDGAWEGISERFEELRASASQTNLSLELQQGLHKGVMTDSASSRKEEHESSVRKILEATRDVVNYCAVAFRELGAAA